MTIYNKRGTTLREIQIAVQTIKRRFKIKTLQESSVGIVLGSGLGYFVENLKSILLVQEILYKDIPYFPNTSIGGHNGILIHTKINNTSIFILQGRIHLYEGYSAQEVVFPIRTLNLLGVSSFILTHAAGGINKDLYVGDLMLIHDHINFTGDNPLLGKKCQEFGKRFLDLSELYDKRYLKIANELGQQIGLTLQNGVCGCMRGPSYETVSEIKMLACLGCDSVGMSVVHEAIAAYQQNSRILAMSCITNKAAGCSIFKISHNEVKNISLKVGNYFTKLLLAFICVLHNIDNKTKSYFS